MLMVISKDLSCSQINYEIFKQLNKLVDKIPCCLVYKNLTNSFYPAKFPVLNYSKIFSGYLTNSLIIATDLESAYTLSNTKNMAKKIFYVWELEFLKNKKYATNYHIYNRLPVFTRSKSYKQALDNYANIDSKVEELNLEKLWTLNIS